MTKPSIEKITHSHTRMRLFDFEQGPDHEFEGLPHRTYSNSYGEGCYLCATLSEIKQLQAELAKKDAEIAELMDVMAFIERWANHHAPKYMNAEQALSVIQHHPSIKAITRKYSDGKVPETHDPYAENAALKAENLGYAKALLDLEAEVARLTADARRYQGATR